MANKFFWYELMTSDRAAAEAFYADVIGWQLQPFPADGPPYTVLEADGLGVGGIMPIPEDARAAGMQPTWVGYIHVIDLDTAVAELRAAGGLVHRILDPIPHVGRIAIASDPQGAMFNLLQPDGPETPPAGRAPLLPAGTAGGVDWHELHSSDWETAFDFYASLYGWTRTDAMEMGPLGTYQMIAMEPVGDDTSCGVTNGAMYNDAQAPRPYWSFYVHVDAIDAAVGRIEAGGGKVLMGPHEVPGGMWVVNAQDPQGARFDLVAPKR
ncbi:VOC family protein [Sphingomonas sp. SRS2]|uniref:VOC family protein n=1 Tax=Sphingomonas sp. SRS2 TaxID=133190 RepID=UPI0006184F5E|nr:VOC family protein [Sphingomonas sp. SRS2]KKC27940.1 glyoxalase [Sphingomonas sp. SRS2]